MSPLPSARSFLVNAMLLGTALMLATPGGCAWAQPIEAARQVFDVPAGALEDALNALARQAGITLSFDPALVRDRVAGVLSGSHTVAEGLARLLAAHPLEAVRSSDGVYLVRPSTAAAPAGSPAGLPPVTVSAVAERADGPVEGYVAQRSATATRTDTPLIESPRSITVVTREQMDDQAVQTVEQSLRYSAGVLTEVAGHDLRFSSLTVRGLAPAEFLDGFRLITTGEYTGWLAEPQGLERVELLRGPSAALHDQMVPGGVINMVSKRPTAHAVREVGLTAGSHRRTQGSFDLGGRLDADGRWLFRLNGMLRNSSSQTDFGRDDRAYIAPALTWKPSAHTTVTLLADLTRDRMSSKSIWPQYALLAPNPNGPISVSRFVGEPGVDHYHRDTASVTYLLSHRIDDNWTFRQNARYSTLDLDFQQTFGSAFRSDLRTLERRRMLWRDSIRVASIGHQVEGRFQTGPLAHTLLLGVDYQRYSSGKQHGLGAAPPIDAYAPAYLADPRRTNAYLSTLRIPDSSETMKQFGVYVQDQVRSGPWALNLAVRHERTAKRATPLPNVIASRTSKDSMTTYNADVLYRFDNGLAPYASYATSYTPVLRHAPELGRQFEMGLKYRPARMDALFTLAVFDLRKNNATTTLPEAPGLTAQFGQLRTRGLELEARASLTSQLKMLASLTVLDAEITEALNPLELGKQPPRTARHTAALWLDHRFGGAELQGWRVGAGVRYVGKVPADASNSIFNPSYTLVDAAIGYDHGPYSFSLNATNLFDRKHVSGFGQFFGQGRTLQANATFRW